MKSSDAVIEEVARAIRVRHGIDPLGSLALRARLERALESNARPNRREDEPRWIDALTAALRVSETRFHRDGAQLEAVVDAVLGPSLDAGTCRVLSAGCSTGEEPYTLAMLLANVARGRPFEVVGLDVSPESVDRARRARYDRSAAAQLPSTLRKWLVERGDGLEIDPRVASHCRFFVGDLLGRPPLGPYQAIFCRNVLVYLEADAARSVLVRLGEALAEDGVLVVARAEVPLARTALVAEVLPNAPDVVVFRTARGGPPSSRRESPPSRARLVVRESDDAAALVARGQELLARGAAVVQITIVGALRGPRREEVGAVLRRLAAAAEAMGARVVGGDAATDRLLEAMGVLR